MEELKPPVEARKLELKPPQVNWVAVQHDLRSGVYLAADHTKYEYRGFVSKDEYVVVGECMRVVPQQGFNQWAYECEHYVMELSNAH